jgi:hypothetical protein
MALAVTAETNGERFSQSQHDKYFVDQGKMVQGKVTEVKEALKTNIGHLAIVLPHSFG